MSSGMKMMAAVVVMAALVVAAHYVGVLKAVENLVSPPIEDAAAAAGSAAAQEVTDELDQETDHQVAADSAVADEHDTERADFEREANDDESAAIDDLDRRLRADLRGGLQSGAGPGDK